MSESVNNSDYIIFTEKTKDKIIAGVDEVARGTFIGPVVAACVVLPKSFPDETYKQIKDSKKLLFVKSKSLFSCSSSVSWQDMGQTRWSKHPMPLSIC